MTKYEEILAYEEGIKVLQAAIAKLKNDSTDKGSIKRGDFIICTGSSEWAYTKGDRMWVDSVHPGYILARSEKPEQRSKYVFWVNNSDWVKE